MKRIFFLVMFLVFLSACSLIPFEPKVEDNTLSSPALHGIRVRVAPDMEYLGSTRYGQVAQTSDRSDFAQVFTDSYLFAGKGPGGLLEKGVIVRFMGLRYGASFLPEMFPGIRGKFASGYLKIGSEEYERAVFCSADVLNPREAELLKGRGYTVPICMMYEAFARKDGKEDMYKTSIYFFAPAQDVSHACSPEEQERFVSDFLKESNAGLKFIPADERAPDLGITTGGY